MRLTREAIITTAKTFLGVPYRHQHYSDRGVDCIGLIIATALRLGCLPSDFRPPVYRPKPDPQQFISVLSQYMDVIDYLSAKPADVLGMDYGDGCQHVGILLPNNQMIHNSVELRRVSIHDIDRSWQEKIDRAKIAFSWRGLIEEI